MSTAKQVKNISKFVVLFLERIGADPALWSTDANMKQFKALFKTKNIKDKDKPKRASSAYLFFCREKRGEVKARLSPNAKTTAVTTELGKMWRELKQHPDSEELMAPYQELAASDKERYNREMEGYVAPTQSEIKKKRKLARDKNKPKKARSSYLFFCADHREEAKTNLEEGAKATAVTTELGRMWREFKKSGSKEEMEKYVRLYEDDKQRFIAESKAYSSAETKVKSPASPGVTPPKKVSPKVVSATKSGSKKAAAYRLYMKTTRPAAKQELPQLSAREITSVLSKRWKLFSDEEKQQWENRTSQ